MKRTWFVLAATCALVLGVNQAWADLAQGNQSVSLNLGLGIPLTSLDFTALGGGTDKIGSAGLGLGGQYLYNLTPNIGLGGEFGYSKYGDNTSTAWISGANTTSSHKTWALMAIGKYSFMTTGKYLPYALLGLGFGNSSLTMTAAPATGKTWSDTGTTETRTLGDDSGSAVAFALGGGVDVPVNDNMFWGAELRFQDLGSVTFQATAAGKALGIASINSPSASFGLFARAGYKF